MTTARKELPASLSQMSWLDVYLSSMSLLIGLSVVQNVTAQFLYEMFSASLTKDWDFYSRVGFPLVFAVLLVVMPTPATHAILTLLKAGECIRHSIQTQKVS